MSYTDTKLASLVSKGPGNFLGINHFLARSHAQKEEIFKLRYEAYLNEGFIDENDDRRLTDRYDLDGSSVIYGITLRGQLVSTIRLSVLSEDQRSSSSYDLFGDYLDPILDRGERVVDGTRLAVRCNTNVARRNALLYTLNLTAMFASVHDTHYGAIAVREGHVAFYERYGFEMIGETRLFNGIRLPRRLMLKKLYETYNDMSNSVQTCSSNRLNGHSHSPEMRN